MRFLVISDTHGRTAAAEKIYMKEGPFDAVIHLGDLVKDAEVLAEALSCDIFQVAGNCDPSGSAPLCRIIDTEYGRILLVHGHEQNVKSNVENLLYLAEEKGCRAAFFGHTHKAFLKDAEGIYLLNPGSLTLPSGSPYGSYAIVTTEEGSLTAEIKYDRPEEKKNRPKVQGGFIRNILNNSDRL